MPYKVARTPAWPVTIDLTTLSTPRQVAIVAPVGTIDSALLQTAREARIRALPVIDSDGLCDGAISLTKLTELHRTDQPLTADLVTVPCNILPFEVPVHTLVEQLDEHGIAIHGPDPDDPELPTGWFGIVSVSDLNRPIFRAHIYRMLVVLESALGHLIMEEFGDDWEAIHLLSEPTQRRIRDFYNEERDEGIELSPITNATLGDLFHIAVTSRNVWRLMGFPSPDELRPIARRISDLRNTIMHPVRPLIVNEQELHNLVDGVRDVEMLTSRLAKRTSLPVS